MGKNIGRFGENDMGIETLKMAEITKTIFDIGVF